MKDAPLADWQGEPVGRWAEQWGVPLLEAYRSLGSTNDRARELAEEGAAPFTVIVADEQRSGRGRGTTRWHSPLGCGLWLSVILPARQASESLPVSLLVGLAASEMIERYMPDVRVGIEWPNDLILGGRKTGGILCETAGTSVIAGIGINLRTPDSGYPREIESRATSLEGEGAKSISPGALGGSMLTLLKNRWTTPPPPVEALDALRARDVLFGRMVESEQRGRGLARGIAEDGSLVLERPDSTRVFVVAGSVRPVDPSE